MTKKLNKIDIEGISFSFHEAPSGDITREKINFIKNLAYEKAGDNEVVLHISHNDADGKACFVADKWGNFLDIEEPNFHIACVTTEVNNVGNSIYWFCKEYGIFPDEILITDVSFTESEKEMVDVLTGLLDGEFINSLYLIDHHKTALWLGERYTWCLVVTERGSAAEMYLRYLKDAIYDELVDFPEKLEKYISRIGRYDTWRWKDSPDYYADEYENILCSKLTTEYYVVSRIKKIVNKTFSPMIFSEIELSIVENSISQRDKSLVKAMNESKQISFKGYSMKLFIGNINAGAFSELSLDKDSDDIAAVLYVDSKVLSLRTKSNDVDVSAIAKVLAKDPDSGGGHPKASGCTLSNEDFVSLLMEYYK